MTDQDMSSGADHQPEEPEAANGGWDVEGKDDPMLAQLVAFADIGVSVGVTFTIGGSVVTGQLCSGKDFIEHTRDQILAGSGDDLKDFLEPHFNDRLAVYDNDRTEVMQIAYVHLRDAVIYNVDFTGIPSKNGVFWRGRLDAIDGWSLGTITIDR